MGIIKHTGNPELEEGEFENFTGQCEVSGIEDFITTCKDGEMPRFIEMGGRLKIGAVLRRTDGLRGPAISVTPAEYVALVHLFGGSTFAPERDQRTAGPTILQGKELANVGGKPLTVDVKEDWVNRLPELDLPVGGYTFVFKGAHRNDRTPGNYDFFQTRGESWGLWFSFEVVGDATGAPCRFDGYEVSVFMQDVFVTEAADGTTAREAGTPMFMRTGAGGVPKNAKRWENFYAFFAPQLADHDWQVDAEDSKWGICEVEKPQYVIVNKALEAQQKVVAYYGPKPKGKGRTLDMYDLPKSNPGGPGTAAASPTAVPEKVEEQSGVTLAALEKANKTASTGDAVTVTDVCSYITSKWPVYSSDDATGQIFQTVSEELVVFSVAGRAWAKQHLSDNAEDNSLPSPYARAGIEDRTPLHVLTSDQLGKLLQELEAQYGKTEQPW